MLCEEKDRLLEEYAIWCGCPEQRLADLPEDSVVGVESDLLRRAGSGAAGAWCPTICRWSSTTLEDIILFLAKGGDAAMKGLLMKDCEIPSEADEGHAGHHCCCSPASPSTYMAAFARVLRRHAARTRPWPMTSGPSGMSWRP